MSLSRARVVAKACGFVVAVLSAGCGGDKSGDRAGTGGTNSGSGGSSAGSSSSAGGSSSASGGATSTAGANAGGLTAYPCDGKAPGITDLTAALDSSGKWGTSGTFTGGSFTYQDGTTAITAVYGSATYHITGHVAGYAGFGMWFGPAGGQMYTCVDASQYAGVSFDIKDNAGTLTSILFEVQAHGDSPVDTANNRGGCVWMTSKYGDCVYPQASVTIPTGSTTVKVPWSMFAAGKPETTTTGASLDGLQWQFPWKDGATAFDVDVEVSNVKFY